MIAAGGSGPLGLPSDGLSSGGLPSASFGPPRTVPNRPVPPRTASDRPGPPRPASGQPMTV